MTRRILLAVLCALLLGPAAAQAHPLGNFTVNHYTRAELSGANLYVRYVADIAEIPTLRERPRIEAAGGLERYAAARASELGPDLVVVVDGRRAPLRPLSHAASLRPGAAGLQVLRLAAWYRALVPHGAADAPRRVTLSDQTFAGRLGWREVVVRASSGAAVSASSAPAEDISDELRRYPDDLLSRPLDVTTASFAWSPGEGAGSVAPLTKDPESRVDEGAGGGFESLVEGDLTLGVIVVSLLLALGWGALHAVSPGHGKAMVAAYLVGTRGTARHALLLGGFVTLTHIASVVLFGLAALWLSHYILPEDLFRWLSLVAGLLVIAIGVWVLRGRARGLLGRRRRGAPSGAQSLSRPPERVLEPAAVGAHGHGHHEHRHHGDHHHDHDHGRGHGHDHGLDHDHRHGGRRHTHAPPRELSLRRLAAAGATAGILPCPSAMVLLLGAISLNRAGYGLLLVAAFSVGLAGVLAAIGLLVLYARGLVERVPVGSRLARSVPVLSAVVIVILGVVLTARALPEVV